MKKERTDRVLNRIILILTIMIFISGGFLFKIEKQLNHKSESIKPRYHFYCIGKNKVDSFWKDVYSGVEEKAEELGVYIEYNAPRFTNMEDELKYVEIAALSNVDGIILYAFDNEEFRVAVEKAKKKGIPVVLVENEISKTSYDAFVGADSEKTGEAAGKLMEDALNGQGGILVIGDDQTGEEDLSSYGKLKGFKKIIEENREMFIEKVESSKRGILTAEEIVENVLKQDGEIQAIYTTNSADTMGAAQAVIDSNKVGKIQIIGYGDNEEIQRLIDQGVVYGTVAGNSKTIGERSVEALIQIKDGEKTEEFVDTDYRIIK